MESKLVVELCRLGLHFHGIFFRFPIFLGFLFYYLVLILCIEALSDAKSSRVWLVR